MGNGAINTLHHDAVRSNLVLKGDLSIIFHTILFDAHARNAFYDFLIQEFATENLIFYEAAENLKFIGSSPDSSDDANFFTAFGVIVNRFMTKGSKEEINISMAAKDELHKLHARKNKRKTDCMVKMSKAQKEIIEMITGCLPRFEASNEFQKLIIWPPVTPSSSIDSKDSLQSATTNLKKQTNGKTSITSQLGTHGHHVNYIKKLQSMDCPSPSLNLRISSLEKILIVETNSMLGKLLRRYMQPRYDVTLVTTGEAAIEQLLCVHYDCILITIDSLAEGDITGIEVIVAYHNMKSYVANLHLRKHDFNITQTQIIGMSSERNLKLEMQASSMGFEAILMKPFSLDDFRNAKGERLRIMSRVRQYID